MGRVRYPELRDPKNILSAWSELIRVLTQRDSAGITFPEIYRAIRTVTANDDVLKTDGVILGDATAGDISLKLPSATADLDRVIVVKKIDSSGNSVTLTAQSGETIDGASTKAISTQNQVVWIITDGTKWYII